VHADSALRLRLADVRFAGQLTSSGRVSRDTLCPIEGRALPLHFTHLHQVLENGLSLIFSCLSPVGSSVSNIVAIGIGAALLTRGPLTLRI
jgi:hypothetical protein